jgi:uncharacterized protein YqeY
VALKEQIMNDIKEAMKAKQPERLSALRMLQSAVKNKEIELRPGVITDSDIFDVVKKMVKQRKESIEQYTAAGRTDLAEKESAEADMLSHYLPTQLNESQITVIVEDVIKELKASSQKEMGAVMKEAIARCKGAADNKIVSQIIKSKLQ